MCVMSYAVYKKKKKKIVLCQNGSRAEMARPARPAHDKRILIERRGE